MKPQLSKLFATGALLVAGFAAGGTALAQPLPGQPAPTFKLEDVNGRTVSLADLRGRYVVLEWNNPNCPFVRKHYASGNMQSLQARYGADKVAWLLVNSTAPGTEDYMDGKKLAAWLAEQKSQPTALLLDPSGEVGRAYAAKVTPQMVVIDPRGTVIYNGAIDDKRSANAADVAGARNYVAAALDEARAGKPVSVASTTPYGCTVKYKP
ncbi:MAG TPA: thioredoxin family protein [Burkholderiaceae bacterium]|jgi:peroxiredoxin|nr:thioredoxin family protein [Burkholderiaceae bacterium]HRZ01056.1 thioredoxin family protein [Burkholderiaceae bacterium]